MAPNPASIPMKQPLSDRELLNGENWDEWQRVVRLMLGMEGLWDLVQGKDPWPPREGGGSMSTSQVLAESEWKRKNSMACQVIDQSIKADLKQFISTTQHASDRWSMLKNRCQGGEEACERAVRSIMEFKIDREKEYNDVDLWGTRLIALRNRALRTIPSGMTAHELLELLARVVVARECAAAEEARPRQRRPRRQRR